MSLSKVAYLVALILVIVSILADKFLSGNGVLWGFAAFIFGHLVAGETVDRKLF